MFQTVELPLWLLVLIVLFAMVTFASHFLFPSVRWFLRRRMERVVAELNKRLERPIQPFKLARRVDMIQRLSYDPKVAEAIAQHAADTGVREDVAFEKARHYAREIVPAFSATAYFGIAIRLARWLSTRLFRVHLSETANGALADIDQDATLVYVMNHRSNMDYVLVTYLAAEESALSYAVGEWARSWPIGPFFRSMGAFFIRRGAGNALYRRVLSRYVQMATDAGVTQAVFPEGGLSLTGAAGDPRLGILSYIVSEFDPSGRDIVFVPVSLSYDRVLEDRILTDAGLKGHRRFRGSAPQATVFMMRYLWRWFTGRARRLGNAAVAYGKPLSLAAMSRNNTGDLTANLAAELMSRVRQATPVLPVPLVSHALLEASSPMTRNDLVDAAKALIDRRAGAPKLPSLPSDPEAMVDYALAILELRRMVRRDGEAYVVQSPDLLAYYSAALALPDPSKAPRERKRRAKTPQVAT